MHDPLFLFCARTCVDHALPPDPSPAFYAHRSLKALTALRALRVLRILRLLRYLESLRRVMTVLVAATGSFAAIGALIILFWLVFSIIGLHVFGGAQTDDPFPNYDTFVDSLVSTFNILNLEDFEVNMFAEVRASNFGSALFFVAWAVLGKYIFLSLFVAVTLETFEQRYNHHATKSGQRIKGRLLERLGSAFRELRASMHGRFSRTNTNMSGADSSMSGRTAGTSRQTSMALERFRRDSKDSGDPPSDGSIGHVPAGWLVPLGPSRMGLPEPIHGDGAYAHHARRWSRRPVTEAWSDEASSSSGSGSGGAALPLPADPADRLQALLRGAAGGLRRSDVLAVLQQAQAEARQLPCRHPALELQLQRLAALAEGNEEEGEELGAGPVAEGAASRGHGRAHGGGFSSSEEGASGTGSSKSCSDGDSLAVSGRSLAATAAAPGPLHDPVALCNMLRLGSRVWLAPAEPAACGPGGQDAARASTSGFERFDGRGGLRLRLRRGGGAANVDAASAGESQWARRRSADDGGSHRITIASALRERWVAGPVAEGGNELAAIGGRSSRHRLVLPPVGGALAAELPAATGAVAVALPALGLEMPHVTLPKVRQRRALQLAAEAPKEGSERHRSHHHHHHHGHHKRTTRVTIADGTADQPHPPISKARALHRRGAAC